jgi:isopenicillin N synthase-like dioxygenase
MNDLPFIDVAAVNAGDVAALGRACREIGFFYVTGHGIPTDRVFAAAHAFFALPIAEKQQLSIKRSPHNRGYVGLGGERLDAQTRPTRRRPLTSGWNWPPVIRKSSPANRSVE